MRSPAQLARRIRSLLSGRRVDQDMDDEMAFHLAMEAAEAERSGVTPDEARRRAGQAFGGLQRFREEGRDARGVGPMRGLSSDLRYGFRALRGTPVFTAVAMTTLALGIGANTAIFSVVNAVLLQPLPFPDTRSLVSVWDGGHSLAEFSYLRDRTRTLESVATYMPGYPVSLSGDGEPAHLTSALVSAGFFDALRVRAARGRLFEPGEDQPSAAPVVVISHGLWQSRFGGDPSLVGRLIDVDGVSRQVVGIAPAGLTFPSSQTRLWIPLLFDPAGRRCAPGNAVCVSAAAGTFWGSYGHHVIGRLQDGVTREQAQDDVLRIGAELQRENPVWRPAMPQYLADVRVSDLRDRLVSDSRGLLFVLLGAVALVLLLACANVANLLVVRNAARQRELSIRAALGAGPRRLARQLLIENLLLAAAGGGAGVALAVGSIQGLLALLPGTTPRLDEVRLDGWVLGFTVLATLLTGMGFGIAPARRLARTNAAGALAGARSGTALPQRRLAAALVSTQIAIGVMLAVGAGLLVRSLARILDVNPGFATTQVVTAQVNPPRARYASVEARRALAGELMERLSAAPGIAAAGLTSQLPFDQSNHGMAMWIDGWTTDPNSLDLFELRRVSPGFFATLGIPIVAGRAFDATDGATGTPVAIVSETAVRRFWSGREAVGGQLRYPWPGWLTVVGVAGDVRNNDLKEPEVPTVYVPFAQNPFLPFRIVARSNGDPAATIATIRSVVADVSGESPVSHQGTMDALVQESVSSPRAAAVLLLGFGGLALLLGSIGTYGLVAYGVETRRQEFAVRIAIGARTGSVMRLVLREGARLAMVGLAIGLAGAVAVSRVMQGLLYQIAPTDPVTFVAAPLLLGATALFACAVPAWRATRVDPNAALRRE